MFGWWFISHDVGGMVSVVFIKMLILRSTRRCRQRYKFYGIFLLLATMRSGNYNYALMKPTRRRRASIVSETRMVLRMPSPVISGGPLLSLRCSAWVRVVWDYRVSRAGPLPFYWPTCSLSFVSYCFPFLFFHYMGWYCWAVVFWLIGC